MEVLRNLFDFGYMYDQGGVDTVVYAVMAMAGTTLFAIRLAFSLLFGLDGDMDLDGSDIEHGTGFSFFSIQSIIGFFMGAGWAGLAARIEWQLGAPVSALVSGGFGALMMTLSSAMMFAATKLKHEVTFDLKDAVGKTGTAYTTIPEKGSGTGQVRVGISGRSMTVQAVSTGEKIEAFKAVKVDQVRDDNVLVVSPSGD